MEMIKEEAAINKIVLWFGKTKPNQKEIEAMKTEKIVWLKTLSESKVTCYEESKRLLCKIEMEAEKLKTSVICGEFPSYLLQQLFHARNDNGHLSFRMPWNYANSKTIFVEVGRI